MLQLSQDIVHGNHCVEAMERRQSIIGNNWGCYRFFLRGAGSNHKRLLPNGQEKFKILEKKGNGKQSLQALEISPLLSSGLLDEVVFYARPLLGFHCFCVRSMVNDHK